MVQGKDVQMESACKGKVNGLGKGKGGHAIIIKCVWLLFVCCVLFLQTEVKWLIVCMFRLLHCKIFSQVSVVPFSFCKVL